MKPWLFDILACPIDKHFPLELYIFSFETKPEEFESIINVYRNRDINYIKQEKVVEISMENEILLLKDNIIMEKSPSTIYLELIIASINELDNITDKTNLETSKNCFKIIESEIKPKIIKFSKNINLNQIEDLLPELFFINKIKLEIEIESGLLFCKNCGRWYPIIETIPQMLPDEYRDEIKEVEFLKTKKNLLDEEFFNQDLKPFNI
ncbi:MAG: Trm112 family protein [Promethearchaeota archaeon]